MEADRSYLAEGFVDVDCSEDAQVYAQCLNYIDTIPYFQEIKQKSYQYLHLKEADALLEIGCGVGNDLYRMAELVPKSCHLTGIDRSRRMIERAKENPLFQTMHNLAFTVADGKSLPFEAATFDRCRIDRTLQHIPNPQRVIEEVSRVLQPGGRLVVYDNDWSSFSLSLKETRLSRMVENYWCDAFVNGRIALHLKGYLLDAGFEAVTLYPSTLLLDTLSIADAVYDIEKTVMRMKREGVLGNKEAAEVMDTLRVESEEGKFLCVLTSYTVSAQKRYS